MEKQLYWNLDDIVPVDKFDFLAKEIEEDTSKLDFFYDQLNPNMPSEKFKEIIESMEHTSVKFSKLSYLPTLMESTDQDSPQAKFLKEKAKNLILKYEEKSRLIDHWIYGKNLENKVRLDDENAKRLFASTPNLTYILNYMRTGEKYVLTEREEDIISKKDSTAGVIFQLKDSFVSDFSYVFKPSDKKRSKVFKTEDELLSFCSDGDKENRKNAYKVILNKYKENIGKFFMIYQSIVKDFDNENKIRGYKSAISSVNFGNHVSDETIKTLLDTCTEKAGIYQDHFRFKAKELGMEKLTRFDIFSPLGKKLEKINFEKGMELVLESLEDFSPNFLAKAKEIINANHIDSHPKAKKSSGAFCCGVNPETIPYVLLNYIDNLDGVSTLAHELGHGIHFLYSKSNSLSAYGSDLPLGEIGSTFSEMILFENLLNKTKKKEEKKFLLSDKLDSSFATVLRQNYFVKFELSAHEKIPNGITEENLSNIYFDSLREQFGDSVEIDPLFRYEWARIPHIFETPFYCYSYGFGELVSLSLFSRYKQEGKSFLPKIEKILAYGGSEEPQKILAEVGIDMNSKKFWEDSFDVVKDWQRQLREI